MENYKTPITIVMSLIIASIFFVQSYSSLMMGIKTVKIKTQDKRLALSNEVRDLEILLSKSKSQTITTKDLIEFDLKNGSNLSSEFGKAMPVAYSGPPLSSGSELYWELKNAQENKKDEELKLKDLRVFDFIPPWRLLFVSGLGVVIVRLLNRGADFICDRGAVKPAHTIGGFFLLILFLSAVICLL